MARPIAEKGIKVVSRSDEYVPNAETLAAIKEAREGKLKTYTDVNEMMNEILG